MPMATGRGGGVLTASMAMPKSKEDPVRQQLVQALFSDSSCEFTLGAVHFVAFGVNCDVYEVADNKDFNGSPIDKRLQHILMPFSKHL